MFDSEFWEERYSSHTAVWSKRPNPQLVAEAGELQPGRALDAGCGEGADSIWLASLGWQVTAVDFSATALRRGADQAEALDVGGRIRWVRADLATWTRGEHFDLVSAQFMHLPPAPRAALFARLAGMVAAGGTLLIVGHHPSDLRTTVGRPPAPELFYTAEEVASSLDLAHWEVAVSSARPRAATDDEGREATVHDTVVVARRLALT